MVPVNRRIIVVNWVQNLGKFFVSREPNYSVSLISANLGGSFNLVFGISVLSLIEVIYALTVRCVYHYKSLKQLEKIVEVQPINIKEKEALKQRYGNLLN